MFHCKHLKPAALGALVVAFAASPIVTSAAPSQGALTGQKFVTKAATTNLLEIKLGKLALKKSHTHVVRIFAHWMIFDHSKVQKLLKKKAASAKLSVPGALPAKANKHYEKLSKLSGAQFDKAYAAFNIKGHEKAVALLKKEKASHNNAGLSALAASGLPVIEGHLIMAKHMSQVVNGRRSQ